MKKTTILFLVVLVLLVSTSMVLAADGFTISLHRDFGYGGFGNQIQGTFSLKATSDKVLEKVIFMMDETVLGEDSEAPFKIQFSTDDYPPGEHDYWAQGLLEDGTILESNRVTGLVLTKEETGQNMFKIIGILVVGIVVVGFVTTFVTGKVSKGVADGHSFESNGIPDGFSTRGGSICPKCGKPFSFHFWALNLLTHKADRCQNCGKWVLVKPMSYRKLEETIQTSAPISTNSKNEIKSEENQKDQLKKKLDESKFID